VPRATSRGYNIYMALGLSNLLYVGVTQNAEKRITLHNTRRGANFTKQGSFSIVFLEHHETLAEARKREIQIKKWRRDKKEMLIERYKKGLPTKLS